MARRPTQLGIHHRHGSAPADAEFADDERTTVEEPQRPTTHEEAGAATTSGSGGKVEPATLRDDEDIPTLAGDTPTPVRAPHRGDTPSSAQTPTQPTQPAAMGAATIDEGWDEKTSIDDEPTRDAPPQRNPAGIATAAANVIALNPERREPEAALPARGSIELDEDATTRADSEPPAAMASGSGAVVKPIAPAARRRSAPVTAPRPRKGLRAGRAAPVSPQPAPPQPAGKRPQPTRRENPAFARLIVISGNDEGREFDLVGGRISVGRSVENDIVLTDIAVSRKHLEVEFSGGTFILRDRRSGNGTLINDRVEDGSCQLRHGDRVEIGNTVIRFEHPASRQSTPELLGWGQHQGEEVSTVAEGGGRRAPTGSPVAAGGPPASGPAAAQVPGLAALPGERPRLPPPRRNPRLPSVSEQRLVLPPLSSDDNPPAGGVVRPPHTLEPDNPVVPAFGPGGQAASAVARPAIERGSSGPVPVDLEGRHVSLTMPVQRYAPIRQPAQSQRRVVIGLVLCALTIVMVAIALLIVRADRAPLLAEPGPVAVPSVAVPSPAAVEDDGSKADSTPVTGPDDIERPADGEVPLPADDGATHTLPLSVWGTNESMVASYSAAALRGEAVPDDGSDEGDEGDEAVADEADTGEGAPDSTDEGDDEDEVDDAGGTGRVAVRKPTRRKPVRRSSAGRVAAERRADAAYRAREFDKAASTLRDAAAGLSGGAAGQLRTLATNYEAVGANIDKGQANQTRNPAAALAAYRRALRLDERHGGGAHGTFIRAQLGAVAPQAAASYMAKKRYEAAKSAADAAASYGAGTDRTVSRVREALERQAARLYSEAYNMRKEDPAGARAKLRRIVKIVPPDSKWYVKADKVLSTR